MSRINERVNHNGSPDSSVTSGTDGTSKSNNARAIECIQGNIIYFGEPAVFDMGSRCLNQ